MSLSKILVVPVMFIFGAAAYLWFSVHPLPGTGRAELHGSQVALGWSQGETEGRWLVEQVARDIAEIVLFACDPKADAAQALELTVTSKGNGDVYDLVAKGPKGTVSQTVTLNHYVWSATDYSPWAAALLKAWQPTRSAGESPDGGALTRNLADPTTPTLIREERRLTALLNKQPLNPELHEQAALVIGTFALREAAGTFTDPRPMLCRMSTHMALARALRPKLGVCGELAEVVNLTLAARNAEAVERIAKLPVGVEPWVAALKMRNTGDWRICAEPQKATLLEQIAWARAIVQAVDTVPLQRFLEKYHPPDVVPDWSRVVLGATLQRDEVFARPSVNLEMIELQASWKAWSGTKLNDRDLLSFLNESAGRAVEKTNAGFELNVLGWGQLAAQHQRHLCNALYGTHDFLRRWVGGGQPESLQREIHSQFSGLRLYPFLVRAMTPQSAEHQDPDPMFTKAMNTAVELCQKQPQIVSAGNWALLCEPCGLPMPVPPPPGAGWFRPSMPQGTAFDFEQRIYNLHLPPLVPGDHDYRRFWDKTVALSPYDFDILSGFVASNPGALPPEDRDRQAFTTVSAYNVRAMRQIAGYIKHKGKAYAEEMKVACALNPDLYLTVAQRLLDSGYEEEAAEAFQAAFDKSTNRIAVAEDCEWLVNYYFDHGRQEEAVEIALQVAQVYSPRGLETAGRLMEKTGKWSEAAVFFAAIVERYNAPGPLVGFLNRRKVDVDPKFGEIRDKVLRTYFPQGMQKAEFSEFSGTPQYGVQIMSESDRTGRWRLRKGEVIVALDGYRIENMAQYELVRAMESGSVPMKLITWNGQVYREFIASVRDRRFACEMDTYKR